MAKKKKAEQQDEGSADRNLIEFLRQHPGRSREQIEQEINGDASAAVGRIDALLGDGRISDDGNGRYSATSN